MKATAENCTVSIPTNSRPDSLRRCLEAVRKNISQNVRIQVVQSTPGSAPESVHIAYSALFSADPSIVVHSLGDSLPPGHSRKILSEKCETPFILFMDDDHEIHPGAFDVLATMQETYALDIVAGRWVGEVSERPIGFFYLDGWTSGCPVIHKIPIPYSDGLQGSVMIAHDVLATMLCRSGIFSIVSFDQRYDFYFELFDFFESCRRAQIKIGVAPDATFTHRPARYLGGSSRQKQIRSLDEARFREKWKVEPVFHSFPNGAARLRLRDHVASLWERLAK